MSNSMNTTARSDAQRNRTLLLAAAREVFAEEGVDASLSRVVERSGLGRGSLYRHFPNRYALISAIFEENFDALEHRAETHNNEGGAFKAVFQLIIDQLIEARGFVTLLAAGGTPATEFREHQQRLHRLLQNLVSTAHKNNELPDHYSVDDLALVVNILAGIVLHHPREELRAVIDRALNLLGLDF